MELSLLVLTLMSVGYVCILPFIFFKKGSFNVLWLATAAPYVLVEVILIMGKLGMIQPLNIFAGYETAATIISAVLGVIGVGLISTTIGVHRVPLALWHQKEDAPVNIVKHGPYSRIRHPFYTSFICILTGAFIGFPHIATLAVLAFGVISLTLTAKKEEGKLSVSEFGDEYKQYIKETGRFFPRLT